MTTQGNGTNLVVQGRIVWCTGPTVFEGKQKTDYNTGQAVYGNDGQPVKEYGFGLAVPKLDPATGQNHAEYVKAYQSLHGEALSLYPSGQLPPGFALKYKDGDTDIDQKGNSYADREGYKGHMIISCTTRIPPKFFIFQGGNNVLVNEGIKVGDYVNVQLNIKAHPPVGQGKPGLYVNPSAVQLIRPGKEIINTPSGDQIFGQAAPSYVGQVVEPVAGAMPNVQSPNTQQQMPGANVPQQQMPAAGQAPQVNPNYGVLPQTMQPQGTPTITPGMPSSPQVNQVPTPGTPNNMPVQGGHQQNPMMPNMPGQMPGVYQG